ncbi:MAG TPA: heat-inducible transcriptional repressor HrcA, partial [Gemmatimonadales bacterium]|nr:heat-inducible transcriptional repressor HrcA [Gemmatimonadales bacterium]
MPGEELTARDRNVLDAVVQAYIETAEPAGSRTIAKTFPLGVSAATIRNTMSDLEQRGYLYHPHTSAGRVPTDLAYRVYVDRVIWQDSITPTEQDTLRRELARDRTAIESIVRRAAQVLGVLTQELGVAVAPSLTGAVLEHLELVQVSVERLLMVLVLRGGAARTIFVEAQGHLPPDVVQSVATVLNERLVGLTLQEIRRTLPERLRDTGTVASQKELLNIFVEEADQLFDLDGGAAPEVVLGSARQLAEQPEFHSNEQMRALIELTERRDLLRRALEARAAPGLN